MNPQVKPSAIFPKDLGAFENQGSFRHKGSFQAPITRFAPSPTGYLHVGHAFAAAQAFDFAKENSGTCLLRIEDIDHTRCRPEFDVAILEDLAWLGFSWPEPVRRQSEHMQDYTSILDNLRARGLIYPCFLTRLELAVQTSDGKIPYRCQDLLRAESELKPRLAKGERPAWRLSIPKAASELCGDIFYDMYDGDNGALQRHRVAFDGLSDMVLARKDIETSYFLANTYDDALQDITHVVRGADFMDITPLQVILQKLMGWETPIYFHHPLLRAPSGKKLAKGNKDMPIRDLRIEGQSPDHVLDMAHKISKGVIMKTEPE